MHVSMRSNFVIPNLASLHLFKDIINRVYSQNYSPANNSVEIESKLIEKSSEAAGVVNFNTS